MVYEIPAPEVFLRTTMHGSNYRAAAEAACVSVIGEGRYVSSHIVRVLSQEFLTEAGDSTLSLGLSRIVGVDGNSASQTALVRKAIESTREPLAATLLPSRPTAHGRRRAHFHDILDHHGLPPPIGRTGCQTD